MEKLKAILAKLREPSTWAGIGTIAITLAHAHPETVTDITTAGPVLAGILSIVLSEPASAPAVAQ